MGDEWYSNKELFEQLNGLRMEMRDTRNVIKKYNGLREEVGEAREENQHTREEVDKVSKKVDKIENQTKGRKSVAEGIIKWGGWIISILMLLIAFFTFLNKFYGG